MHDTAQPNATRLPYRLIEALLASVARDRLDDDHSPSQIVHRDEHSNDFAEVRLSSGRSLIVKRARFDWAAPRFLTSRIASQLIRDRTELAVPEPLPLPDDLDERPVEAYWRIDLPTLQEAWPGLDATGREHALHSWGVLASRLHEVRLAGFGPLSDPTAHHRTLGDYLYGELHDRLLPGVAGVWPAALPALRRLVSAIPHADSRAPSSGRLVHNDLHMGNVLCRIENGRPRCVGLIDLETAIAAPPEADLAALQVHHGEPFAQPVDGDWMTTLLAGYAARPDPWLLQFFRIFHKLNMGFYSALIGHQEHAAAIAAVAAREATRLN